MNCQNCGSEISNDAKFCSVCGSPVSVQNSGAGNAAPNAVPKSRLLAGILGLLFGGIGVHNFYLGNTTRAVLQIVVSCVTCGIGAIWGFVEGILILCRQINVDGRGMPLKDDC